ncbi:S41 family peptidase [Caulobacter sp. 73W]|uniref:S41 family peptidase n=1 Tax=Caulobacter sp. 73W TaxID=3161137 RepID=A0AB39KRJ7_9CAUL
MIRRIDGRAASELMDEAIASSAGATAQWRRWRALAKIRSGKPGPMLLEGVRVDGSAFSITVIRNLQAGELEPSDRPPSITELKPGVAYVDLTRADAAAYRAALPKLAQAEAVIFDVRGYPRVPRGLLNAMSDRTIKSAKMEVPLVTRPDHAFDWIDEGWTIPAQGSRLSGKLIFMTDGRAISYAESILGVVEGERLGPIVGEPTAGTNGDVNPLPLPGGYTLTYTGLRVTKQDGSRHHGIGIVPTHPVSRTVAGFRSGQDEQLEVALSLAGGATP